MESHCGLKSLSLCLLHRPQNNLSPVGEVGKFDPVVQPLSVLQQGVKSEG